jgi:hypothetical protein
VPDSSSERPPAALSRILADELAAPAGDAAQAMAREIRLRHGDAVAAILFYGSCLRRRTSEGVLDFYVLVDSYRAAYRSRALALANALLPPNVIYCEAPFGAARLRAKYAVMTTRRFAKAASGRGIDTRVWARFSQPSALVYARDEAARENVVAVVTSAALTMLERASAWLPRGGNAREPVRTEDLWAASLAETYRAELRSERPAAIRGLYAAAPARFDRVAREALRELAARDRLALREEVDGLIVELPGARRAALRVAWTVRRPLAKALACLGLLKTAATFGDWVPYVLWKLERQSGVRIEISDAQRRHPFLLGWPVLIRLLRLRVLR